MRNTSSRISVLAAVGMLAMSAIPAGAQSVIDVRVGGEASRQNGSGHVEARLLPNGIDESGVFLRIYGTHSVFGFDSALSPTGDAELSSFAGNVSVGWQFAFGDILAAPYVGFDFYDRDITPAASDVGQLDDDIGVIVGARVNNGAAASTDGSVVWEVDGSWASTNNRYFATARVGYDFGPVAVGPEVGALGDDEYNAFRAGLFAQLDLPYGAFFKAGGGVQFGDSGNATAPASGDDTAYGTVTFGFDF